MVREKKVEFTFWLLISFSLKVMEVECDSSKLEQPIIELEEGFDVL